MRKHLLSILLLTGCLVIATAGVAWAHVEISPEGAQPGTTETFTAAVPTEKDIPTTEVRLEVPDGFEVTNVQSPSGWQGNLEDNSITWSGGEIREDEVQEFTFEARTPEDAGEFAWNAFQTYQDGSMVEWTGAPDSEEPAPVIEIAQSADEATEAHTHGVDDSHAGMSHEGDDSTLPDTGGVNPAFYGAGALALGMALLALRRHT